MNDIGEVNEMKSNCCGAPVSTIGADEGTCYYQCQDCLNPCDEKSDQPVDLVEVVAKWLYGKYHEGDTWLFWDALRESNRETWRSDARSLLTLLSEWRGPNGERVMTAYTGRCGWHEDEYRQSLNKEQVEWERDTALQSEQKGEPK